MPYTDEAKITTATRLKELREARGYRHTKLSSDLKSHGVSISTTALREYEETDKTKKNKNGINIFNKGKGMSIQNLYDLAEFYGVSCDYLLGNAECAEPNIEEIHKKIGLTQKSIKRLIKYKVESNNEHPKTSFSKNTLFSSILKIISYFIGFTNTFADSYPDSFKHNPDLLKAYKQLIILDPKRVTSDSAIRELFYDICDFYEATEKSSLSSNTSNISTVSDSIKEMTNLWDNHDIKTLSAKQYREFLLLQIQHEFGSIIKRIVDREINRARKETEKTS